MKNKLLSTLLALTIIVPSALFATSGSELSQFANKFIVMKKLAAKCRSNSETTSIAALNALREVTFRNLENSQRSTYSSTLTASFQGLCNKINADVDRISAGISNLENSLMVSDPYDVSDRYLNEVLRFLVVSEITFILKDQTFFNLRDQVMLDIEQSRQFVMSSGYIAKTGEKDRDLLVLDRLANLVDLAGYIYNEQIQWLMNCSFAVQNLDLTAYSIVGDNLFKGFTSSRPPRLYIPGSPSEYQLSGNVR